MARPKGSLNAYKLTPETHKRICDVIRAGNYIATAAQYAGIHKDTFFEWARRGRQAKSGIYFEFVKDVDLALAQSEAMSLNIITKAAVAGQWQAAAWKLERMYPDRWGRRDHLKSEISGPGGGPVTLRIFDDAGELVEVIEHGNRLPAPEALPEAVGGNLQPLALFPNRSIEQGRED